MVKSIQNSNDNNTIYTSDNMLPASGSSDEASGSSDDIHASGSSNEASGSSDNLPLNKSTRSLLDTSDKSLEDLQFEIQVTESDFYQKIFSKPIVD
ncbi:MAG: hypothetical protein ABII90_05685 [Bacteroidota bacterium]